MVNRWDADEQDFQEYKGKMRKKLLEQGFRVVKNANKSKSISLEIRVDYHPEVDEFGYDRSFACLTSDTEINRHNFRGTAPKIIKEAFGNKVNNISYESRKLKVNLDDAGFSVPNNEPSDSEAQECFYIPSTVKSGTRRIPSESNLVGKQKVLEVESDEEFKQYLKAELEKRKKK